MFKLQQKPYFRELIYFWGLVFVGFLIALFSLNTPTQLEAIKEKGVLRVAIRNTPMTYYIDKGQPAGFEYELAQAFASYLGVKMELIQPTTFADLFDTMRRRNAHIAASNLTQSEARQEQFDFGPAYRYSAPIVVYRVRQGRSRPKQIEDLYNSHILVLADSVPAELLASLKESHPQLQWEESDSDAATDLLDRLHDGSIDFTIMNSSVFDAVKSFYPGLNKGLELGPPQPIAWMLPYHHDGTLKEALNRFFERPQTQELIKQLETRYFSRQNQLNFFDTGEFRRAFQKRYPPLEQYFMLAAQETGIDHLLLAAIAYQESHWREGAVSPTGVRGIMMLTEDAASEVGVSDRTDPRQSIFGGAEYLVRVRARIPDRIPEPDHTWFALAGYNIGFGHLEDARLLTQKAGKNPDRWEDVSQFLPLLANEKYYSTLRYGYARGYEPVTYVANIRKYMEMLSWEEQLAQTRRTLETGSVHKTPESSAASTEETPAVEDESPAQETPTAEAKAESEAEAEAEAEADIESQAPAESKDDNRDASLPPGGEIDEEAPTEDATKPGDNTPAQDETSVDKPSSVEEIPSEDEDDTAAEDNVPSSEKETAAEDASPSTEKTAPAEDGVPSSEKETAVEDASPSTEKTAPAEDGMPSSEKETAVEDAAPSTEKTAPAEDGVPSSEKETAVEDASPSTEKTAPITEAASSEEDDITGTAAPAATEQPATSLEQPEAPARPQDSTL